MKQPLEPQPDLGAAVRARRLEPEVDLSQDALAAKAGISVSHLSRLENGEVNPTWGTMRQIAEALDLSVADLAARSEALAAD